MLAQIKPTGIRLTMARSDSMAFKQGQSQAQKKSMQ